MSGSLGQYIRDHRRQRNLTQRDLAELVGVHYTAISHLESDRLHVSNDLIEKIAYEICDPHQRENMYVIAGIFDSIALSKMAGENPIICRLLRKLPGLSLGKINQILEILNSNSAESE